VKAQDMSMVGVLRNRKKTSENRVKEKAKEMTIESITELNYKINEHINSHKI
jgi:hypothetical protein